MKIIRCPLNGPRPMAEFAYGGEVRPMPDPDACSDAEWTDYVFNRASVPAVKREWWCHVASGYWFIVDRNTASDDIIATHTVDILRAGDGR